MPMPLRIIRMLSVAILLALIAFVGFVVFASAADAKEVPGSWNVAKSSHTKVTFDALAGGRTAAVHISSDFNNRAVSDIRAVTTAYTKHGHKLWVADVRNSKMKRPEVSLRNNGMFHFSYNKDMQKFRPGTIMQFCVTHVTRIGPDKTACAKNKV